MKKFVYCVWSQADDPYAGGPWLEEIFGSEEDAQKFVKERNDYCDREYGKSAKFFYYEMDRWEVR